MLSTIMQACYDSMSKEELVSLVERQRTALDNDAKATQYWAARFSVLVDAWNAGNNDAVLDATRKFLKANDSAAASEKLKTIQELEEKIDALEREIEHAKLYGDDVRY